MTQTVQVELTETDFTVRWDDEHTYPFFEDDYAKGVYGYGHTDKAAFAAAVSACDEYLVGTGRDEDDAYTERDVRHGYVQGFRYPDGDFGFWEIFDEPFPGATPITWVWR